MAGGVISSITFQSPGLPGPETRLRKPGGILPSWNWPKSNLISAADDTMGAPTKSSVMMNPRTARRAVPTLDT